MSDEKRIQDPAWADSEAQMRRLRDWFLNYEGRDPQSAKETVDMFTTRYSEMRRQITDIERYPMHTLYYDPRVLEKFRLRDTPAAAMTDTD